MIRYCYACGLEIKRNTGNKDHIPAQAHFDGYGVEYKINRITVPAHRVCNSNYSRIDQNLRDIIGTITEGQLDRDLLIKKSIKSILMGKKGIDRISQDDYGLNVEFNYDNIKQLHIKNFKGVFYHEFRFPMFCKYRIETIMDGDQAEVSPETFWQIYGIIDKQIDLWKVSGHKDIFKYKIGAFSQDGVLEKLNINTDSQLVYAILVYHEDLAVIVFAAVEGENLVKMDPEF